MMKFFVAAVVLASCLAQTYAVTKDGYCRVGTWDKVKYFDSPEDAGVQMKKCGTYDNTKPKVKECKAYYTTKDKPLEVTFKCGGTCDPAEIGCVSETYNADNDPIDQSLGQITPRVLWCLSGEGAKMSTMCTRPQGTPNDNPKETSICVVEYDEDNVNKHSCQMSDYCNGKKNCRWCGTANCNDGSYTFYSEGGNFNAAPSVSASYIVLLLAAVLHFFVNKA